MTEDRSFLLYQQDYHSACMRQEAGARLLALVEHWRQRAQAFACDSKVPAAAVMVCSMCADELAAALRRLPPQLLEEKEDKEDKEVSRVHGVPGSAHGDLPRKPPTGDVSA